ncbi:MAG: ATP-dependent helicase [Lachnospiraceae bacterium]|nr:ATP-dependent helicase [Lachnospiraceae bacterium]
MLNQSQQAAACHGSGPCLVIAGPGSGKTTVLTERICYLVEELHIPEEQILVVTFTREAAREMQNRYLWKAKAKETKVTFGTFHRIFFQILKEAKGYQTDDIISGNKKHKLLETCRKELGIEASLQELSEEEEALLKDAFEAKKEKLHLLDFDDMIVKCRKLLSENQPVLEKWRDRFQYFLVDEMQDMSDGQYEILRMLAYPRNNLYMVGDDDQAIYGFRGANPSIMLGFPKDYPDARQIVLHVNYRCRKQILGCAMELISHNKHRFAKEIQSASGKDGRVEVKNFENPMTEAAYVVSWMKKRKEQYPEETIGVLFRNRMQALILAEQCKQKEVQYSFTDNGSSLLCHWITKDIRSYLRMAYDTVYREDFLLVANKPNRGISRYGLDHRYIDLAGLALEYRQDAATYGKLLELQQNLTLLGKMRPYAAINFIRKGMGYEGFVREYATKSGMDMDVYLRVMEELGDLSKDFPDGTSFVEFLLQDTESVAKTTKASICFHTYHGAKGLEFDRVVLLDVNDGITPSKRAEGETALEEERRMFYVALTRAKKELVICTIEQRGNELLYPSRFLQESNCYASSDASASSNMRSKTLDTASNSSSEAMLSRIGAPSASSL